MRAAGRVARVRGMRTPQHRPLSTSEKSSSRRRMCAHHSPAVSELASISSRLAGRILPPPWACTLHAVPLLYATLQHADSDRSLTLIPGGGAVALDDDCRCDGCCEDRRGHDHGLRLRNYRVIHPSWIRYPSSWISWIRCWIVHDVQPRDSRLCHRCVVDAHHSSSPHTDAPADDHTRHQEGREEH